ncbi:MAG TPA: hypothetical protein ENN13_01300 [Candidatus Altiarchaeales archaeon]|nr:hypothetical protein [Candidatus Altiarchaeales archaeon]
MATKNLDPDKKMRKLYLNGPPEARKYGLVEGEQLPEGYTRKFEEIFPQAMSAKPAPFLRLSQALKFFNAHATPVFNPPAKSKYNIDAGVVLKLSPAPGKRFAHFGTGLSGIEFVEALMGAEPAVLYDTLSEKMVMESVIGRKYLDKEDSENSLPDLPKDYKNPNFININPKFIFSDVLNAERARMKGFAFQKNYFNVVTAFSMPEDQHVGQEHEVCSAMIDLVVPGGTVWATRPYAKILKSQIKKRNSSADGEYDYSLTPLLDKGHILSDDGTPAYAFRVGKKKRG